MSSRLKELAERRARLVRVAANQRSELAQAAAPWRTALRVADHGVGAVRFIANHKALVTGAVALACVLRPAFAAGLLRLVWTMWRGVRVARRLIG